ncbi:ring finger and chy zinc finger domain-containing protein [Stemphylium lycopersici]|nr:ring finger and chy zinc finger domain-containing protein [Stemphylium lycopersici]
MGLPKLSLLSWTVEQPCRDYDKFLLWGAYSGNACGCNCGGRIHADDTKATESVFGPDPAISEEQVQAGFWLWRLWLYESIPPPDHETAASTVSAREGDVVDEEQSHDDLPIGTPVEMSANPSRTPADQLRRLEVDPSQLTAPPTAAIQRPASTPSQNAATMSESLPADDGMAHLRMRIHEIRALNVSDQERARMVHNLMTERYHFMRPTSPASLISHDRPFTPTSGESLFSEVHASSPYSSTSDVNPDASYNLREGDPNPTYRPQPHHHHSAEHGEDEEDDVAEGELVLGCQHYKRNVKVQCFECRRWYTCRHCHDAVEGHNLNRKMTQNMLCMLWDNNSKKKIYHCPDCGICRRGEGLGKDFYHCKSCNVCISISHATTHKCLPRATEGDCPICGDHLFTSSTAVVSMPCGHYLHKDCYNLYMQTAYKCPICKKSAVCMDLQWQKLTQAIEGQPMPEQFANTRAVVQCNDCSAKSSVKYHWLGNQCATCDSYNTNELRILNGPESEEAANAILDADIDSGSRSPASISSPSSQAPLRSPRYYFQPDEPEETWLPGQLPSFPFQMPQFPGRPRMPQMPQMPQFPSLPNFPQIPQFPQMPQMPQMPDAAQQMLERVRRSFDTYLNPTGDVRAEDVPIIDLGHEERTERSATDGTTVKEPSLPQYVLERLTQSLVRFRNDLNPALFEDIPNLDLSEDRDPDGLQFWGEDGGRLNRFVAGDEDNEDESSSDESEHFEEEEESEDDEDVGMNKKKHGKKEFDLPEMAPTTKSAGKKSAGKTGRSAIADVVAREYTIHLHKRVHGVSFKKRAPRAVKEIRAFAKQAMGTNDVRLDPQLNKKVWESGIKGVPFRLRVRISRKRNDEEGAKEKLYSYVQAVNVKDPKGLHTQIVEDA